MSRIERVEFTIADEEHIRKNCSLRIDEYIMFHKNEPKANGPFDPRLGPWTRHKKCATCGHSVEKCLGHFGHIELAWPVFHNGFIQQTLKYLRLLCFWCSEFWMDPEQKKVCVHLENKQFELRDKLRHLSCVSNTETHRRCRSCEGLQPYYSVANVSIECKWTNDQLKELEEFPEERAKALIPFTSREALEILRDADYGSAWKLLDVDTKRSHPASMIITLLPVPPPLIRPPGNHHGGSTGEAVGKGKANHDDLTTRLVEILKRNQVFVKRLGLQHWSDVINPFVLQPRNKSIKVTAKSFFNDPLVLIDRLSGEIAQYFDADAKIKKSITAGNNPTATTAKYSSGGSGYRSIGGRIKGKDGRVRYNLMGKRCDQAARTVISPDPISLDLDEVGIPLVQAIGLRKPVMVTELNLQECKDTILRGPEHPLGAHSIELPNGRTIKLDCCQNLQDINVTPGCKIFRYIRDGDYVVVNRHPSLHIGSMMAHKARIHSHNTMTLNLSACAPYNADFDGDEMNLHVAQKLEADAELMGPMAVKNNIVSPQSNRPMMALVQDAILASFLLTSKDQFLNHTQMMDLAYQLRYPKYGEDLVKLIPPPTVWKPQKLWTGKQAYSMLFPDDLYLKKFVGKEEDDKKKDRLRESKVLVKDGLLLRGRLCKSSVGIVANGLVHFLWLENGPTDANVFISDAQRLLNFWLSYEGFSTGMTDCVVPKAVSDEIQKIREKTDESVAKLYEECQKCGHDISKVEPVVNKMLRVMFNKAGKLAIENTRENDNYLVRMVGSGSKGGVINLTSILAIIGQQCVEGRRIMPSYDCPVLPSFARNDLTPASHGCVARNYRQGLTADQFFFHSMGGREGLSDTAVKSVTGDTTIFMMDGSNDLIYTEIGKWIDTLMNDFSHQVKYYKEDHNLEMLDITETHLPPFYIPTTNEKGKVTWSQITTLTRHDPGQFLFKVTTQSGRSVIVTESKSLIVWNSKKQELEEVLTESVKIGDKLPVTTSLPFESNQDLSLSEIYWQMRSEKANFGCKKFRETLSLIASHLGFFISLNDLKEIDTNQVMNDVVLDPIVEIVKLDSIHYPKVYDLTIPSTLNFGLANGLQVRDTSNTGYIQRQLTKALESVQIKQFGIACSLTNDVVQFTYGDMNFDPRYVYKVYIKPLRWSLKQLRENWFYDDEDGLEAFRHCRRILFEERLTSMTPRLETDFYFPVDINRLIKKNLNKLLTINGTRLITRDYIIDQREKLLSIVRRGDRFSMHAFTVHVVSALCWARLQKFKLVWQEQYETLVHGGNSVISKGILYFFERAWITTGEMVGLIAAQSIGEPTTQMTLKTFHFAGHASKNVTLGVPRMQELLSCTPRPTTPYSQLKLIDKFSSDKQMATQLAYALECLKMKDFVQPGKIVENWDPIINKRWSILHPIELKGPIIQFNLIKSKMIQYGLFPEDIADAIMVYQPINCLFWVQHSMPQDENWIVEMNIFQSLSNNIYESSPTAPIESENGAENDTSHDTEGFAPIGFDKIEILEQFAADLRGKTHIRGFVTIKTAEAIQTPYERVLSEEEEEENHDEKPLKNDSKWSIRAIGTGLRWLLSMPFFDPLWSYSNNIDEMNTVMGIESVFYLAFHEYRQILSFDGGYINQSHIAIPSDIMVMYGYPLPLTRNGVNRLKTGALVKCTYEETNCVLTNAAATGEVNDIRGPTEHILLGQMPIMGTGTVCVVPTMEYIVNEILVKSEEKRKIQTANDKLEHERQFGQMTEFWVGDKKWLATHLVDRFKKVKVSRNNQTNANSETPMESDNNIQLIIDPNTTNTIIHSKERETTQRKLKATIESVSNNNDQTHSTTDGSSSPVHQPPPQEVDIEFQIEMMNRLRGISTMIKNQTSVFVPGRPHPFDPSHPIKKRRTK
jgi:DNA-directed RNA polymerase beta' subunit